MADDPAASCPQYTAAFGGTLGAFVLGTYIGWIAQAELELTQYSADLIIILSDDEYLWVGSMFTLGGLIACIPLGILVNIIGRKMTMLFLAIPLIFSWLMIIFVTNVRMFYAGRFIGGMACGVVSVTAPIYIAEISEQQTRGRNGVFFQLNIALGVLYSYIFGAVCNLLTFSILCLIIPVVFVIYLYVLPESPLFLLYKGEQLAAEEAMAYLRGADYSYEGELAEMQFALEKYPISQNPLSNISGLKRKATWKGLLAIFGLMLFQQASGINVVLFYAPELFGDVTESIKQIYTVIIIGVVQVVATIMTLIFVEYVRRRILLIVSGVVMTICTLILGFYFYTERTDPESVEDLGPLTILAICLFLIMYSFGFGPIPWLMLGELFAPDVRVLCASFGAAFNWLIDFLVTHYFVSLRSLVGIEGSFWLYTALTSIGTAFVYFVVPETTGISLDEIQDLLDT